jgi:uncharacterized protein
MRIRTALIAAAVFCGSPLLAQTPATTAPPKPAAHQPGVAAHTATPANPADTAANADKVDPAKDAAIRHLMDLTETAKMGDEINAYITKQVHDGLSQALPPERLAKFMQDFSTKLDVAAPASAITDAVIPIYAKAFSVEDLQGLIQFYESPLGQRVVKALPQVAQSSQRLGVQMEQKGALTVLQGMSDDYPELKQMLQPEQPSGADRAPGPDRTPAPAPAPAPPSK